MIGADRFRRWMAEAGARRKLARQRDEFAHLNESEMRDLGLGRCEFDSFLAESQELAEQTRLRVAPCGRRNR